MNRSTPCRRALGLASALALLVPVVVSAQVFPPQQRLDGASNSNFSIGVAVEGSTAVVGASRSTINGNTNQGAASVFLRNGTTWALNQTLLASDGRAQEHFGSAVAIDGNTLVVGADGGGTASNGAAYVFVRSGTTWVEQAKLIASDGASNTRFGYAVAVEGDTVVVGAPLTRWTDPLDTGAVYVYTRSGTAWSEQKLVATSYRDLGTSVGVSGNTICAGAVRDGGTPGAFRGAAFLFTRGGTTWTQQQVVVASDPTNSASFGAACTVEGDTLVVGAPNSGSLSPRGAAYVFNRLAGAWTFRQKLGDVDRFGKSLSLQGAWLAVGSPDWDGPGYVYAFELVGGSWTQRQATRPNFGVGSDNLGAAIGFDGTTIIVGSPALNSAYLFSRASTAGVPGAPVNFATTVSGSSVSMSWGAPTTGGPATGYTLLARTAPGAPPVVTVPLGNVTSFAALGPDGTFLLSVRASNAQGDGPESNTATVALPGGAALPPAAPTGLGVTVSGTTVTFSWTAPVSGGAPTGYLLVAGLTPGFTAPIASVPMPAGSLGLSVPGVPPGTYYARVQSTNAAGASAPSNEVMVNVAGASAPGAPVLNAPVVSGATVSLSWTPGSGGAPAGYTLIATATPNGAPIVTVPLSGTSVSFAGVPGGTYFLRLTASNAAGTSAASNQVTLVVP